MSKITTLSDLLVEVAAGRQTATLGISLDRPVLRAIPQDRGFLLDGFWSCLQSVVEVKLCELAGLASPAELP